jgi:hypothetical protein
MRYFVWTFGGFVFGIVLAKVVTALVARRRRRAIRPGSLEAHAEEAIRRAGY